MNTILGKLISLDRVQKRALQVGADIALCILCFALAMFLRLESVAFLARPLVWAALLPALPITIFAFAKLRLYRSLVRFISGGALAVIAQGAVISAVVLAVSAYLISAPIPRSVPGIYAVLLFLSAGGIRFLMRGVLRRPSLSHREPVAIYGAGESGRQVLNALSQGAEYAPVAFLDDDPALWNTVVAGQRVYAPHQAEELVSKLQLQSILLAMPSASRTRRREIVEGLEPLRVEIKTIPGLADIVSGRAAFSDLRHVTPEDLLGRDPVPPREDLMSRNITGKVVLVSGAGGSIGSELCRQIIRHDPAALVLFEHCEFALYSILMELRETIAAAGKAIPVEPILGSVASARHVRNVLQAFKVQTIYHAAAYKHVVLVEENVISGIRNNIFGTQVIAEAAADLGVENFILISTDKAVRPTNVMGATKRIAELICQAFAQRECRTSFSMVRFGNVLGSSGSVIPRFRAQIERGGPVTVTHCDITRYFMTIPEAAQLVIQAGAMARGGDVFVLDMGQPVKILELAKSMIRLHGLRPYVLGEDAADPGDIAIEMVGLSKGEKLYEELLIGENPKQTDHPRIMTAREVALSPRELAALLDRLDRACDMADIAAIRQILLQAALAYRPTAADLHDLVWNTARLERAVG